MEFVDNTGHIFSLPSYKEKPIGYEYDEYSYIFWIDSNNTSKLSVNNFYSKPIYALYELNKDFNIEELEDDYNKILDIEIYFDNSNVYKLISSKELQNLISQKDFKLTDYVNLNLFNNDEEQYNLLKSKLINEDLYCVKTEEIKYANEQDVIGTSINYLMIPIYPIAMSKEAGNWISNLMIHIHNNSNNTDEWCYISIGGEFINEYEELIINGRNMGISLPKDILKSIYQESLYNDEYNEALFNKKMKEYMLNYMNIKGETGNFRSAINSLKWFGYGDKITISKLLRTDNQFKEQFILDYFDISYDILESYKSFVANAFISLMIMINKETDELYKFDIDDENLYNGFLGENKPKMQSLIDYYEKIKIGNHDMPIEDDEEKYWYWKPYFDFSFNELGTKLICLAYYYKKYFLPVHLSIHSASLGYRVFSNDIKLTNTVGSITSYPSIVLNNKNEVEFNGNGIHYFTKQIHYIDEYFNEFKMSETEFDKYNTPNENYNLYIVNDTCINIPISFISNEINNGYFNCVLLLQKKSNNEVIYESHFAFCESESYSYKNFIIYPKKLNTKITDNHKESRFIEYWIDNDFIIKLLVNNKWYEYNFILKIHNPTIDFGTLSYRYYFNDHNYLLSKICNNTNTYIHNILLCGKDDVNKIVDTSINREINNSNLFYNGYLLDNTSNRIPDNYKCMQLSNIYFNNKRIYINWVSNDNNNIKDVYVIYKHKMNEIINGLNIEKLTNIHFIDIDELNDDEVTILIYPTQFNPIFIDSDLYKINELIWNTFNLDGNISWLESFDTSCDLDSDKSIYQYFKQNYNILSPFKQIKFINNDTKKISFNSYMHNKQLVDMNDINYDINIYNIISYHLEHNLLYIDGTLLDNSFYQYIVYEDNEIYIHNDLIGNDIYFIPRSLGNNILLCAYKDINYTLIRTNENEYMISEVDITEDDVVVLSYNENTNEYYDDSNTYSLYDKLYRNTDLIDSNYLSTFNLPNIMKYKNSIHLFGLYEPIEERINVLMFHNNIDMHINGLNFKHGITKNINNNEELTFYVNGKINSNIDSRYPNIYGLYWTSPFKNGGNKPLLPKETISLINKFGFYIKRDYSQIYDNPNSTLKIYELDNIYEFDTNEFTYFKESNEIYIGSLTYSSIEQFYINNFIESNLIDEYKDIDINIKYIKDDSSDIEIIGAWKNIVTDEIIHIKKYVTNSTELIITTEEDKIFTVSLDDFNNNYIKVKLIYCFYDNKVKDLNDLTKYYLNKLSYTIKFVDENNNEIQNISLNMIDNKEYDKVIVSFYYNKAHIVRNRFYMVADYIQEMIDNDINIQYNITKEDKYYFNLSVNNEVYKVELIEFNTLYEYEDQEYMHLISNQNPSVYWYNYDKNGMESLPSYLNEIERYVYDEHDSIENIVDSLNKYVEKYFASKQYADDSEEARYYYSNYLVKDLTGINGKFIIELETDINELRLCIEVINGDDIVTYYTGDEFILNGNEDQVRCYIQLINNVNTVNGYFIPKLTKIIEKEQRLVYNASESGNNIIKVKYLNKEFEYGDNDCEFVYNLYKDFFDLKFNIYDIYFEGNTLKTKLLNSVYDYINSLKLDTYLNYDFYLMHDNQYWYCLYISQETCNKIQSSDDLKLQDKDKKLYVYDEFNKHKYILNYERSSEEYLINRLEFNSSNGFNQFKTDDIVCCYLYNNDRLPFNASISSKWNIHPMSLGMSTDTSFESNGEMTILSLPKNDAKYECGYYKVTVKYSLDRDIQHQFKNTSTIRIS